MINSKKLREVLEKHLVYEVGYDPSDVRERITIKRKKKMVDEKNSNGKVKSKRRRYIWIEILE